MSNGPKSAVLYTGVAGDLRRRVWPPKNKCYPGFTSRYNLHRLGYYERSVYPDAAINREKEIKGWRRSKKIALIESMNPRWEIWRRTGRTCTNPNPQQIAGRSLAPLEKTRGVGMTPAR